MADGAPRQAICGCNRKALADVLVEETEVWAAHTGMPLPEREALGDAFEQVLLTMYREHMTECGRCATMHGSPLHRCNDGNPSCLRAASAFGTANRLSAISRSARPVEA